MRSRTPSRRILGCAIALALALFGLTVWSVIEARTTALDQAAINSRNLAQTLQQHTLQSFQAADLILLGLADRLASVDPTAIPAILRRRAGGLAQIRDVVMLDPQGAPIGGSAQSVRTLADPAAFVAQRDQPNRGLYIGAPVKSPVDGQWIVAMSRRINAPNGGFAGIVVVALDAGYFQEFYDRVDTGPRGAIVLFGLDGTVYFRKPYDEANIGRSIFNQPQFQKHLLRNPEGTFESISSIDGVTRIVSFRQLTPYPFVIAAGLAKDSVLAGWRFGAAVNIAVASVLALTVLCLGVLLDREFGKRAAAEAEARLSATRFERDKVLLEAVLKAMPDGIALTDRDGRMVLWNDLLFEVLDLNRGAITTTANPTAALRTALDARGDSTLAIRDVASTPVGTSVHEVALSTGKWVERRVTRVLELGCIAVYRDIADRKRREFDSEESQARLEKQAATLAQLAEDLEMARQTAEAARIEAETASRTKSSFITGMNHELRTPLNAILGFAQVIREQRFGREALERYSEYADHIITSGEHLLSLINDLLDLAKIEAGKMDLRPQPVDVKSLLASTLLMVRETAASGGVAISLEAPEDSITVAGDARRLKQCFLNLISNAVKFTPAGGRVVVTVKSRGDQIEVVVADTGIGVRAIDIPKIFEPFGQIDSPLARRHIGSGLGLPLARSLVELHGGDLSFRSVEGTGTTVTVALPRRRLVA
jgi:signal transduction histidine kinase